MGDSITAVLDDLGSNEAVLLAGASALATAALFAATHPSRTTALVALEALADPYPVEETRAGVIAVWGTGELQHAMNPDMPWNEEIRATWARFERLAASPGTVALMLPVSQTDVRALLPTIRVPTLVVQHTDNPIIGPARSGSVIAVSTGLPPCTPRTPAAHQPAGRLAIQAGCC
jgi:pimeloyl-ACP methyl ester carboxylesterase